MEREGNSACVELESGGARYLRLVNVTATGISDPEFDARVAALYLSHAALSGVGGRTLDRPMTDFVAEFENGLRDRAFLQTRVLDHADRMFATEYPDNGAPDEHVMRALLRALVHRRVVVLELEGGNGFRFLPYTLVMGTRGLSVLGSVDGDIERIDLHDVRSARLTVDRFEYPSRVVFDPADYLSKKGKK